MGSCKLRAFYCHQRHRQASVLHQARGMPMAATSQTRPLNRRAVRGNRGGRVGGTWTSALCMG